MDETARRQLRKLVPRCPPKQLDLLAWQIEAVSEGIRTASLVDQVPGGLSPVQATQLATYLASSQPHASVLYLEEAQETFIVHAGHVKARQQQGDTIFVDVQGSAPRVVARPAAVALLQQELLDAIEGTSAGKVLSLPSAAAIEPKELVGFTGWLLDYPVAYCFAGGTESSSGRGGNALSGWDLVRVQALVAQSQGVPLPLMSFTIPVLPMSGLAVTSIADGIVPAVRAELEARLQASSLDGSSLSLEVDPPVARDMVAL